MYRAFGDVLAYLVCVGVLFMGFCVCGYVVLSPYHIKFKTLGEATTTLLSILNGDEIYATLAILDVSGSKNPTIFWFTRFFICVYVIIFTIVVLNLLVAILVSAYEVITKAYNKKKEDERDLGRLDVALQDLMDNVPQSKFLQSLTDKISKYDSTLEKEISLKTELRRFFRISKDTKDTVTEQPKTIKAFMNQDAKTEKGEGCSIIKEFKTIEIC